MRVLPSKRLSEGLCPICGQARILRLGNDSRGNDVIDCSICGNYAVTFEARTNSWNAEDETLSALSAATRQASESGSRIMLTTENWESLATDHLRVTVAERVEKTLRHIAARCRRPGTFVVIDAATDYPVADCMNPGEFATYLSHLIDKGLLRNLPQGVAFNVTPTIAGWEAIEPRIPIGGEPGRCFVAMWFDDALDDAWDIGIAPAVRDCGFHPYRQKEDPTNGVVVDRIFAEIRRAQFVVADFTGQRQSVYYEVGFASGLGREIISCCKEGEARNLAFDTRHLGHIVWKSPNDLREKLTNSIRANIIPKR